MRSLANFLLTPSTLICSCRAFFPAGIESGFDNVSYGAHIGLSSDVVDGPESTSITHRRLATGIEKGDASRIRNAPNFSAFAGSQDRTARCLASPEENADSKSRRTAMKNIVSATSVCIGLIPLSITERANAMYENAPVAVAEIIKLPSGVTYQDLREGDGDVVSEGKRVNIQWSLKRSNGYNIDSSANNDGVPFIFVVGNRSKGGTRAIPGLDDGIRGMRVGGIRRIVMPPALTFVEGLGDGAPGPIPPGFGPKQRIDRVMKLRADVPDESFLLDVKPTRVQ